jgi:hypothetical protein
MLPTSVLGIDWSGDLRTAHRKIWLCEVGARGVVRLERGRSRETLVAHLVEAYAGRSAVVIGFDFAFSFPDWFVRTHGGSGPAAWRAAAEHGERWLEARETPFWGRAGTRPDSARDQLRRTEEDAARVARARPSSVFQVAGNGSVGTGSIRGMPLLLTLREAGFAVWPFDAPRPDRPLVVEIWPRLAYGERVRKKRPAERLAWVDRHAPALAAEHRDAVARSDDAFDALAAALAMWRDRATFATLPTGDAPYDREGRIWSADPPA